jgi:hypothetical protein
LLFTVLAFAGLEALAGGFGRDLVLATDVFATGMTQNLKQRAYNHNRQREEGRGKWQPRRRLR